MKKFKPENHLKPEAINLGRLVEYGHIESIYPEIISYTVYTNDVLELSETEGSSDCFSEISKALGEFFYQVKNYPELNVWLMAKFSGKHMYTCPNDEDIEIVVSYINGVLEENNEWVWNRI